MENDLERRVATLEAKMEEMERIIVPISFETSGTQVALAAVVKALCRVAPPSSDLAVFARMYLEQGHTQMAPTMTAQATLDRFDLIRADLEQALAFVDAKESNAGDSVAQVTPYRP